MHRPGWPVEVYPAEAAPDWGWICTTRMAEVRVGGRSVCQGQKEKLAV